MTKGMAKPRLADGPVERKIVLGIAGDFEVTFYIINAVPAHVGRIIWTADSNRFGWESFLGMRPGGRSIPVAVVPARTANLSGLPPAFVGVGSLDLFHDDDVDYARRLNDAGVPCELIVVPGAFHGFDILPPPARVATSFNATKIEAFRRGLNIPPLG